MLASAKTHQWKYVIENECQLLPFVLICKNEVKLLTWLHVLFKFDMLLGLTCALSSLL